MKPHVRRRIGFAAGVAAGLAVSGWLNAADQQHLNAPGPMNAGHGDLACDTCHREAPGTLRQQLQAITQGWLHGERGHGDLGYRAVGNAECERCHDRPDDRHPVFRFLEPRFAEARAALHPEQCASCHREHAGVRVTLADGTYCRHCHDDVEVERDPLDVPHRELARAGRWDTCLGCHDYHGNHALESPAHLDAAIPRAAIDGYLRGGPSPYPAPIVRARPPEVTL